MHRVLQINVTANHGSTGVIADGIGLEAINGGWKSWIAYGRGCRESHSNLIKIGSECDVRWHGLESRLLDNHGLASRGATRQFIRRIKEISPDIIHLHNIHGYYINYQILFQYLKEWGGPVVWTLHDCWPMTGHCAHFMGNGCEKWKNCCYDCPQKSAYPASAILDRSEKNYRLKRESFTSIVKNLTIVSCSECIANYARQSFLKEAEIKVIHNGIDIDTFRPNGKPKRKMLLGVASVWNQSKGLDEFVKLREILPSDYNIILVGLTQKQIKVLPSGITGITRTSNRQELADLYSQATAFINPTFADNFPTVNLESLACGTPVITYRTGGSPEALTEKCGIVVEQGDVKGIAEAVSIAEKLSPIDCRAHAEARFNKADRFADYINLYNSLI